MTTPAMRSALERARSAPRTRAALPPAPKAEDPELGTVKLCRTCDEWWPLDGDFWYRMGLNSRWPYWSSRCRACWAEYNTSRPGRSHKVVAA